MLSTLLTSGGNFDSYARFISVLLIFVAVLAVTLFTTRWIAKYQKMQSTGGNIDVVETYRLAPNKFVQIVRLGETYVAVAICKDTVTLLAEIPKEQISFSLKNDGGSFRFQEILEKAKIVSSGKNDDTKKEQDDSE